MQVTSEYPFEAITDRLYMRPLKVSDSGAWEDFFVNNESLGFFAFDPALSPSQKAKDWIESQLLRYKEGRYGLMALLDKRTGELVGQCGLLLQEIDGKEELEIGYHVLPRHWGKGFATEAALFFKEFAFQHRLADSVISIIHIHNVRSQKVAQKNGMESTVRTKFRNLPVYIYRIGKESQEQRAGQD
jgi:[ribosomal protein S5]-alanine N-acetyltransferase